LIAKSSRGITRVALPETFKFKNGNDKPLILWCSSHETLAKEEIPLLLEAGFRVIPLLTNMWTMKFDESLDEVICQDWKKTVGLDQGIVRDIQACRVFETSPNLELTTREEELLESHVDVFYVTVLPNLASYFSKRFKASVVFRPFGHGNIQTYSNISHAYGISFDQFTSRLNYIFCPILRTLMEPENPELCQNSLYLRAFVSPERLRGAKWIAGKSDPVVIDTIPRIQVPYYMEIYKRFISDFDGLPLKILGGNQPGGGGDLDDPRIVGRLPDEDYHRLISSARVCIYHGQSRYHLHYHPIEFMFIGLPVLFHRNTPFAVELASMGIGETEATQFGMYSTAEEAKRRALRMLEDPSLACELSNRQAIFRERIFCREKALDEARWLRTVCESQLRWIVDGHLTTEPAQYCLKMRASRNNKPSQANPQVDGKKPPEPSKPNVLRWMKSICKKIVKKILMMN